MAESLVEQVTQLPGAATVGWSLRAWLGVAELPRVPATPRSGRFWAGC